jgi:peptide deformylase
VSAFDMINNKDIEIVAEDMLSVNLQHEIDHLDGILYYDKINKINPFFVGND